MSEPTPEPAPAPATSTTEASGETAAAPARATTTRAGATKVSTAKAGSSAPAVARRSAEATAPLKVHHLRPAKGAHTATTRVGRGEASKGKTAGRGTKGTSARYQVSAAFEGGQMPLHMRLPKLRGFTNPFKVEHQVVNLDRLTELFPDGGTVGVAELVAAGAVRKNERVKVLGTGEAGVALTLTVHAASASAQEKVAAAGGSITLL